MNEDGKSITRKRDYFQSETMQVVVWTWVWTCLSYQSHYLSGTPQKCKYTQPVITVKFDISASQVGQIEVIVSQIYSKSINEKINKALELRMKLKRMHRVCRHLLNILLSWWCRRVQNIGVPLKKHSSSS